MSENNAELQSLLCSLERRNLIEAAAGTGKTYNIQNIFVRLILEKELPVEKILVVTYTDAAAAELRDRIHRALSFCLERHEGRSIGDEAPRADAMLERCPGDAGKLLRRALRDFDDGAISTIHGFCRKILQENSFECGVLFNSTLEPDMSKRMESAIADFCRRMLYDGEDYAVMFNWCKIDAAGIGRKIRNVSGRAHVRFKLPPGAGQGSKYVLTELKKELRRIAELFHPGELMRFSGKLNKGYSTEDLQSFSERLTEFLAHEQIGVNSELLNLLMRLTSGEINKKAKAKLKDEVGDMCGTSEFFRAIDLVCDKWARAFAADIYCEAAEFVAERMRRNKSEENIIGFDDLINMVHESLYGISCDVVRRALQRKYLAGIIDEFQDTDSVQYEIFTAIFGDGVERPFFMVGDPRQAIYAFRGGDLATYRRADAERTAECGNKYTLTANYRSAAGVIDGVNAIFARHGCPFADPAIKFAPVRSPEVRRGGLLLKGTEDKHPLQLHRLPEASPAECIDMCAAKIAEFLQSDLRRSEAPDARLQPSDFAVLVFSGKEAENVRLALRRWRIPAVFTRAGNVFASPEAADLLSCMEAVLDYNSGGTLCNALSGAIGNCRPEKLFMLNHGGDPELLESYRDKFVKMNELWRKESFLAMFNNMLAAFDVYSVMPSQEDGERQLTNIFHLGDLLQQESMRRKLSPEALIGFLADAIAKSSDDVPEYEQLLETDRAAVRIMTVHGSKGLEFPVVMLPSLFSWFADDERKIGVYHGADGKLEYDLSDDTDNEAAFGERLQELLRLTYVAITRAKYRCHIYWGKMTYKRSERHTTALDWLFRMRSFSWHEDFLARLQECPPEDIPPELLPDKIDQELLRHYTPVLPQDELLPEPRLTLSFARNWKMQSFSALSPQSGGHESVWDYDRSTDEPGSEPSGVGIFAIAGGAATGNAWHRILELIDFQGDEKIWRQTALYPLLQFGVIPPGAPSEAPELELTLEMLKNCVHAPLHDGVRTFALDRVGTHDRLNELEFNYKFRHNFDSGMLRRLIEPYATAVLGDIDLSQWNVAVDGGFLNGFIDMVFRFEGEYYILDWKSNRLRGRMGNFSPDGVKRAMAESSYYLQYLIYCVALIKYLRLRLGRWDEECYEQFFGGVFYLFLRGVSAEHPGRGVFFDRVPYGLLTELEEMIG